MGGYFSKSHKSVQYTEVVCKLIIKEYYKIIKTELNTHQNTWLHKNVKSFILKNKLNNSNKICLGDRFRIMCKLDECMKCGYNIWEDILKKKSTCKYVKNNYFAFRRYLRVGVYIEEHKSIDMDNHEMKILLYHLNDIDTDTSISLEKEFDGVTLVEMFAISFMKQDRRIPVQILLDSNNICMDQPPKYDEYGNDNIKKPLPVFI
jgi:predicted Zn-ribbon and HTH transcriptional regulator